MGLCRPSLVLSDAPAPRADLAPRSRAVYVEAGTTRYEKLLKGLGVRYDRPERELHPRGFGRPAVAQALVLTPYTAQETTDRDALVTIVSVS
jgi:hypothetical protein